MSDRKKCDGKVQRSVMEGTFPSNESLKIIITDASSTRTICKVVVIGKNENQLESVKSGYSSAIISNGHDKFIVILVKSKDLCAQDINPVKLNQFANLFVVLRIILSIHISMLKRSLSMEFDSDQFKPPIGQLSDSAHAASDSSEMNENAQSNKKMCHSPDRAVLPHDESDSDGRGWSKGRNSYGRFAQNSDNSHVTQSRSIFSHENSCIYGNPKDEIKSIENPDASKEVTHFDNGAVNALDLSCKSGKCDEEKPETYQNYQKTGENRSNLHIKLVSPTLKKPSIPEQLQIAKIQQQQRRSIQQQQKLIQQMRRSLDPTGKTRSHNSDSSPGSHNKNVKYFGNNTTNQEQNDVEYQGRMKEEYQSVPGSHFPQYPLFEPGQHKELPDGHPILPLLDPVYFSALYNAHGFLPPSSPSIAAAFIGTLQDALPKLPLMFPSTSSSNSPILPQKGNDNHN